MTNNRTRLNATVSTEAYNRLCIHALMERKSPSAVIEDLIMGLNKYEVVPRSVPIATQPKVKVKGKARSVK